jgi:transposase
VDQKLAVLTEAAQPGMSISYVARRHGISPSLVFGWRRRMTEGGQEAVRADDEVVARTEVRELQKRIRELERVLGKKTLENEILREALKVAQEKNFSRTCRHYPTGIRREAGCADAGSLAIASPRAAAPWNPGSR